MFSDNTYIYIHTTSFIKRLFNKSIQSAEKRKRGGRERKLTGYFGNRWVLINFLNEVMVGTPRVISYAVRI